MARNRNTVQYRSNLIGLVEVIGSFKFTTKQKNKMRSLPFWNLINSIIDRKIEKSKCRRSDLHLYDLIDHYSTVTHDFVFNDKHVNVTVDDMRSIFGIEDGTMDIEVDRQKSGKDTSLYGRRFTKCTRLTRKIITSNMKEAASNDTDESVDDLCRLMVLFLLLAFFIPTKCLSLSWGYLTYVEDVNSINTYNWSSCFLNYLLTSLRESEKAADVSGCVMILPYWFLEKFGVYKPMSRDKSITGCARWDLREFSRLLNLASVDDLLKVTAVRKKSTKGADADDQDIDEDDDDSTSDNDSENDRLSGNEDDSVNEILSDKALGSGDGVNLNNSDEWDNIPLSQLASQLSPSKKRSTKTSRQRIVTLENTVSILLEKIILLERQNKEIKSELTNLKVYSIASEVMKANYDEHDTTDSENPSDAVILGESSNKMEEKEYDTVAKDIEDKEEDVVAKDIEEKEYDTMPKGIEEDHEVDHAIAALPATPLPEKVAEGVEHTDIIFPELTLADLPDREHTEPRSMIKRIKGKTDRKRKQDPAFSYSLRNVRLKNMTTSSSKEILDLDDFASVSPQKPKKEIKKIPASWRTAKKMSDACKEKLNMMVKTIESGKIVWQQRDDTRCYVTLGNLLDILKDDPLSNNVIDAYSQILRQERAKISPSSGETFIIYDSSCWQYVTNPRYEKSKQQQIGDVVLKWFGSETFVPRYHMFPMNSNGGLAPHMPCNHWTLLVFDCADSKWYHYNSLLPRDSNRNSYLDDAKLVKEYVERVRYEWVKSQKANQPSFTLLEELSQERFNFELVSVKNCPQQEFASVDCGYHVCHIMTRLANDEAIEELLSSDEMRIFKAEMVAKFICDYSIDTGNLQST